MSKILLVSFIMADGITPSLDESNSRCFLLCNSLMSNDQLERRPTGKTLGAPKNTLWAVRSKLLLAGNLRVSLSDFVGNLLLVGDYISADVLQNQPEIVLPYNVHETTAGSKHDAIPIHYRRRAIKEHINVRIVNCAAWILNRPEYNSRVAVREDSVPNRE
jgi:hypothetical protein